MIHRAWVWSIKDNSSAGSVTSPSTCSPEALAITRCSGGSFARMTRPICYLLRPFHAPAPLYCRDRWPLTIHAQRCCLASRIADAAIAAYVSGYQRGDTSLDTFGRRQRRRKWCTAQSADASQRLGWQGYCANPEWPMRQHDHIRAVHGLRLLCVPEAATHSDSSSMANVQPRPPSSIAWPRQ